MNANDGMLIVSSLTVTEFKRFKKAVNLLCSMGMHREDAILMVTDAIKNHRAPGINNLYAATR